MKKMLLLIVFLICVVAVLTGCAFGSGMQDYSYNVGTGYTLYRVSAHNIIVTPTNGNDGTKPEINPKVVEIAWNERYVLVKQIGMKRKYPYNPDSSYEIPDNSKVAYFILDTVELKLYGGYDLKEFSEQRKLLEISDEMKLKTVNSYPKEKYVHQTELTAACQNYLTGGGIFLFKSRYAPNLTRIKETPSPRLNFLACKWE